MSYQTESGKWVKDRLFAPGEECCTSCGVKLRPGLLREDPLSNITPGHFKKRNLKCRACRSAYEAERRVEAEETNRILEEESAFIREVFKDKPQVRLEDLIAADDAKRHSFSNAHQPSYQFKPYRRRKRKPSTAQADAREGMTHAQLDAELKQLLTEIA